MKRTLLAMGTAAVLTLGTVVAVPTTADAQWGWGHSRHFGHFWGGPRFGFRFGVAPRAFAFAGSCVRVHRISTPFGWRWRRVFVC